MYLYNATSCCKFHLLPLLHIKFSLQMFCNLFPGLRWVHESGYGRGTRSLPKVREQKTDRYVLSWVLTCEYSRLWWSLAVVWFVWRRRRRRCGVEGGMAEAQNYFPFLAGQHWSEGKGRDGGWSHTSCGYCAFLSSLCRAYLATRGQHHTNYASGWRTGEIAQGTLPSHCLCHSIHDILT